MDNFSPINQKDPLTTFFVSFQLIAREVNKIKNLLWFSVTGRFYAMKSVSKNWKRNPIFLTSLENSIVEKGQQTTCALITMISITLNYLLKDLDVSLCRSSRCRKSE